MGLFKPDLYRSFVIGFLVGTLLVGALTTGHWDADVATPAQAATGQTD